MSHFAIPCAKPIRLDDNSADDDETSAEQQVHDRLGAGVPVPFAYRLASPNPAVARWHAAVVTRRDGGRYVVLNPARGISGGAFRFETWDAVRALSAVRQTMVYLLHPPQAASGLGEPPKE